MKGICKGCNKKTSVSSKSFLCLTCAARIRARRRADKISKYQKVYYPQHKEIYRKTAIKHYYNNREKRIISSMDYQRGKILKVKCEDCGSTQNLEYHHLTYERGGKSEIKVLCRKCHRRLHRK